jgi:hypothetical protein
LRCHNSGLLWLGGNNIDDWAVAGASLWYVGTYWNAASGDRSVELNPNSIIYQSVPTAIGQEYQLVYYTAGQPNDNPTPTIQPTITVTVTGAKLIFTTTNNLTDSAYINYLLNGSTTPPFGSDYWAQQGFIFTATSASTKISFSSATGGAGVDNVSLTGIPIPASAFLMGSGLLGLGLLGWRRKRS